MLLQQLNQDWPDRFATVWVMASEHFHIKLYPVCLDFVLTHYLIKFGLLMQTIHREL